MTPLDIHPAVQSAMDEGRAMVALESTIIAHGMAYPANLETALSVEEIIRAEGAVPATIAIIDGRLKVGLSPDEIDQIAHAGQAIMKCSVRDIPFAMARRIAGATTVAATMRIAALAGIKVFATGGIGGVHRGAAHTLDVSADLTEFAASDVMVVSAGAKAILDLGWTLEKLETLSVPVIGFGTSEFPAFYSRDSGYKVPMRADTPEEVAAFVSAKQAIELSGGTLVANPIPVEHEIPNEEIAPAIASAISDATSLGITGKNVTPFLLSRLAEITGGRSLKANIALIKNNAKVASQIARALTETI
jgi:pseudouridine-5'-phosphate glycosidase